jgi:hypothetical protein
MPAPFTSAFRLVMLVATPERPVESDVTPLAFALIPLDADVERAFTPVESNATALTFVLMPVEADVDRAPTLL